MKLELKHDNTATKCRDISSCGAGNNSKIHSPSTEMLLEISAATLHSLQSLFRLNLTRGPGLDGPGISFRWGRFSRMLPDRLWGPTSLL